MKRIIVLMCGLLLLVAIASSAVAENSLEAKNKALIFTTSASNTLTGKYMLASDMAVTGSFGFTNSGLSGGKTTNFSIGAGVQKYLKTGDVAPYVGAGFGFGSQGAVAPAKSMTTISLAGMFGVEAFLMKNVSVSGNVQLGFASTSNFLTIGTTNYSWSTMGTTQTGIMVTLYLP